MSVSCLFAAPMSCSPPGSSVHGILQARILKWVAVPFSRDQTQVSHIAGRFFTILSHQGSPRILEWVAYPFSNRSSWSRNRPGSPACDPTIPLLERIESRDSIIVHPCSSQHYSQWPQTLVTPSIFSLYEFDYSQNLSKWDQTIFVLLCPVYFTEHSYPQSSSTL